MTKLAKQLQFKVLIEQDEDGVYVASVPELPGCYTQGKTLEEVRERIKEVIELVLEADKEVKKEKLQSPSSSPRFFWRRRSYYQQLCLNYLLLEAKILFQFWENWVLEKFTKKAAM